MLAELRHVGEEKVVVVSNFTTTLDLIETHCKRKKYPYCRLDGYVFFLGACCLGPPSADRRLCALEQQDAADGPHSHGRVVQPWCAETPMYVCSFLASRPARPR